MKRFLKYAWLVAVPVGMAAYFLLQPGAAPVVRGKSPARPLDQVTDPVIERVQDLALSDPQVIALTTGQRSEVIEVKAVRRHYPPEAAACAQAHCLQVQIYNFAENATVSAFVDPQQDRVLAVLHQPGVQAGVNRRMIDLAAEIIQAEPLVREALGYAPALEDIRPWTSSLAGTECGDPHPCLAAVFMDTEALGERYLWAHVDMTTETFAGIAWSPAAGPDGASIDFTPQGCPAPGSVSRDGWTLEHEVTATDGLRIFAVVYNGEEVIQSAKLVEWHADYGSSGFVDPTGCQTGTPSIILPYGETRVIDILDGPDVVGFEVIQDFRQPQWGLVCNYRYEQHYQFFKDGRFRVVGGAYGKGCSSSSIYRPLMRIDISVHGDLHDAFAVWGGSAWIFQDDEAWWLQEGPYAPDGTKYLVMDLNAQAGYYIEPGQGQFEDGGLGDFAFVYVLKTRSSEGGADIGPLGACCLNDERQGPDKYIDGEAINDQDITIWYVPQFVTSGSPGSYYCWTLQGEPNPVTFPCFGGPMFHPFNFFDLPEKIYLPVTIRD